MVSIAGKILPVIRRQALRKPYKIDLRPLTNDMARAMVVATSFAHKRFETGAIALDALTPLERSLRNFEGLNAVELENIYQVKAFTALEEATVFANSQIRGVVADSVRKGATIQSTIKAVKAKVESLGFDNVSPHTITTVARTQTQLAYNAGKWLAEQDPVVQSIMWGYKYVTVGDGRVRDSHEDVDGVVLPKDDPFWDRWYTPNGYNCRCITLPVFTPQKLVKPSQGVQPDEGFKGNPGQWLSPKEQQKVIPKGKRGGTLGSAATFFKERGVNFQTLPPRAPSFQARFLVGGEEKTAQQVRQLMQS